MNSSKTPLVAILDHTAAMGGGEIALLNLARSLDISRYRPMVMLFSDGSLRHKLEDAGIPVSVMPLEAGIVNVRKDSLGFGTLLRLRDVLLSARFVWRLSSELRRRKVDIVHTNSLKSDILGGAAARMAGIPLIWHVRDRIDDDYLPKTVVKIFRLLASCMPQRVIANSMATLRTLRLRSRHNGSAVPTGMAMDGSFHVVRDGVDQAKAAPDLEAENTTQLIGMVGRISPWKGQHIFLKAAKLVRAKYPSARFQIVGAALFNEKEYEEEIHRLTKELELTEFVEFTGFREDVPDLIAKMDVLVHASTTGEPFGQVILEGMAAGKPVVATNGGGVPEIVVHGVTGLLVPMKNERAMANAICKFLRNRKFRLEAGNNGRKRVAEQFTIQHTAERIQRVYDTLLSGNGSFRREGYR